MIRPVVLALLVALAAAPATAVGLGPLRASGVTDGPGKAFYLTLSNPYPQAERFDAVALDVAIDQAAPRIVIFPSKVLIGSGVKRKLLVIVRPLAIGETYRFRVCAARHPKPEEAIYARVCSTLSARRLPSGS